MAQLIFNEVWQLEQLQAAENCPQDPALTSNGQKPPKLTLHGQVLKAFSSTAYVRRG